MSYQHILIPVDGSSTSKVAIQHAASLAKAFNSRITAICVLTVDPFVGVEFVNSAEFSKDYINKVKEEIQDILTETKTIFASEGIEIETQIIEGQSIYKEIVNTTTDIKADLIVIGSHGRKGFKKFVLGSVTQALLSEAHVPVLVVRE
ncbi:universal stress protein [Acinetobacter sp. MD2(2019)]|uniref:universal stress protein n=1 Tax=Acinetobacter sp. MD2(2019) TaxID=2605273 RepID=UPI002D1EE578|nr:universal stress protein [Acinetobacter sp. MD2(2019)]MEB3752875.1 universal stress protein [Acinetobacter sp. MD2(2019)]